MTFILIKGRDKSRTGSTRIADLNKNSTYSRTRKCTIVLFLFKSAIRVDPVRLLSLPINKENKDNRESVLFLFLLIYISLFLLSVTGERKGCARGGGDRKGGLIPKWTFFWIFFFFWGGGGGGMG